MGLLFQSNTTGWLLCGDIITGMVGDWCLDLNLTVHVGDVVATDRNV